MQIFKELADQYYDIDDDYASIEFSAASKGWTKKEYTFQRKRVLNDQAYFLFMFTRLEDRIREQSSTLIKDKQNSIASWKQRAVWDILPVAKDGQLNFKNRLALLTPKGSADYTLVLEYYKERNSIAHGGDFISQIIMHHVIPEFKRLYSVLKA